MYTRLRAQELTVSEGELVLVLERSFWRYCERASSSAEHAKEQFQTLLGNFEAGIGMCVCASLELSNQLLCQ